MKVRCCNNEVGTNQRENPHASTTLIKQVQGKHGTQDRNIGNCYKQQRPINNNWSTGV